MPEVFSSGETAYNPFDVGELSVAQDRVAQLERQLSLEGLVRTSLAREAALSRSLSLYHRRQEEKAVYEATHDQLTGALNRRGLEAFIKNTPNISDYAVLYSDGDNFKAINDMYGHDRGDQVLVMTTEAIQRTLRKSSVMARIGGDEFMTLIYTGPQGNRQRHDGRDRREQAENARERIDREMVRVLNESTNTDLLGFGLTTGIALPVEGSDLTIDDLKKQAEAEMRERKKNKQYHHRPASYEVPAGTETPPTELE